MFLILPCVYMKYRLGLETKVVVQTKIIASISNMLFQMIVFSIHTHFLIWRCRCLNRLFFVWASGYDLMIMIIRQNDIKQTLTYKHYSVLEKRSTSNDGIEATVFSCTSSWKICTFYKGNVGIIPQLNF